MRDLSPWLAAYEVYCGIPVSFFILEIKLLLQEIHFAVICGCLTRLPLNINASIPDILVVVKLLLHITESIDDLVALFTREGGGYER